MLFAPLSFSFLFSYFLSPHATLIQLVIKFSQAYSLQYFYIYLHIFVLYPPPIYIAMTTL